MATFTVRVRHNKSRAVLAEVRRDADRFTLVSVRPLDGPLPEVEHLIDQSFRDLGGVRNALIAAMKGEVGDTLDHVWLSEQAYDAWMAKAAAAARSFAATGGSLDPDSIPDERARPLPDGSLLIWVHLPNGTRVELAVPEGQWAWRVRPS